MLNKVVINIIIIIIIIIINVYTNTCQTWGQQALCVDVFQVNENNSIYLKLNWKLNHIWINFYQWNW